MTITKTGSDLVLLDKTAAPSFGREVLNMGLTHPLAAGANAMFLSSGDMSVGETLGTGIGGSAGYLGAQKGTKAGLKGLSKKLPSLAAKAGKVTKYLPGWLKTVGMVGTGLVGSIAGADIGKRVGDKAPVWKREAP